ncbi:cd7 antigen-like [Scomber japonicus]|uniref:cd7 antigen-like n=1 Tax=Scomber japonicus TaxID=13676 RepID=UPI002306C777|nr:cd7 antigen-like [Scomber japonicus]
MSGIQYLVCLCILLITQSRFVRSDIQFIEKQEGDSVVFPCAIEQRNPAPFGVYLKRTWLVPNEILFMHTEEDFRMKNDHDKSRTSVSGDPKNHSLIVTISELTTKDTDRYYCEFIVENLSTVDEYIPGKTEFFLLVTAAQTSADSGRIETCAGGSVVLPCLPAEEGLAVKGVSLKRQKGQAPVEVLYDSRKHHGNEPPSYSQFPAERFRLTSALGPGGITYNLTLQQLQPEDSALYSCQLLQQDRPDSHVSLGRQALFVSVKGDECSCSSSSTLLYALSSAVVVLLLAIVFLGISLYKVRPSVKPTRQAPIYEEMTGFKALKNGQKLAPNHLEDTVSVYNNTSVKKSCLENHYESPTGALCPRNETQT